MASDQKFILYTSQDMTTGKTALLDLRRADAVPEDPVELFLDAARERGIEAEEWRVDSGPYGKGMICALISEDGRDVLHRFECVGEEDLKSLRITLKDLKEFYLAAAQAAELEADSSKEGLLLLWEKEDAERKLCFELDFETPYDGAMQIISAAEDFAAENGSSRLTDKLQVFARILASAVHDWVNGVLRTDSAAIPKAGGGQTSWSALEKQILDAARRARVNLRIHLDGSVELGDEETRIVIPAADSPARFADELAAFTERTLAAGASGSHPGNEAFRGSVLKFAQILSDCGYSYERNK